MVLGRSHAMPYGMAPYQGGAKGQRDPSGASLAAYCALCDMTIV